jgi:hypothetical protein
MALGIGRHTNDKELSYYARTRAISTDEEILRIRQRIGLAEQLMKDMLAERPIDFVDHRGRPSSASPRSAAATAIRRNCSSTSRAGT